MRVYDLDTLTLTSLFSDPLPFQFISSMRDLHNVLYIDLDYPDLIAVKSRVISNTPRLYNLLKDPELHDPPVDNVHYRSSQYLAAGCDLRELGKLKHMLMDGGLINNAALLFTAEVSLTYMDQDAVGALIAWTATLPDGKPIPPRFEGVWMCWRTVVAYEP